MKKQGWIMMMVLLLAVTAGCEYAPQIPNATPTGIVATTPPTQAVTQPSMPTLITKATAPTDGDVPAQPTEPTQITTEPTVPSQPVTDPATPATQPQPQPTEPTQPARPSAPDFLVGDDQMKAVYLSDFRGKPVVLNFWATWCPPCKAEMPDFDEMYGKYGDQVQFMMINLTTGDYGVDYVRNFVKQSGFRFPVFYDVTGQAGAVYAVQSIPVSVFIDKDGNVADMHIGMIQGEDLEQTVQDLLNEM